MVFNPMAFTTAEQREQLMRMQALTQRIQYVVHTDKGRVEIALKTSDPEAAQLLPQIQEGIVSSVTQMLYQLFAMQGERV